MSGCSGTICQRRYPSLNLHFCQTSVQISVGVYFWILCSVSLIYVSIPKLILHSVHYCGYITSPVSRETESSHFIILAHTVLAILVPFHEFQNNLIYMYKYFVENCVQPPHQFENSHPLLCLPFQSMNMGCLSIYLDLL